MKLAFSTLGCPEWNLDQILAGARESGYEGVEWRGYQSEMDLPKAAIFTPEHQQHLVASDPKHAAATAPSTLSVSTEHDGASVQPPCRVSSKDQDQN